MTRRKSNPIIQNADDLRGLGQLVIDGVRGTTDLVEAMHATITHLPSIVGKPAPSKTTGLTEVIYNSVRAITDLVGKGTDHSLAALTNILGQQKSRSPQREAALAAMNGVLGDHLYSTQNSLAIDMQFREHGQPLTLTKAALNKTFPTASRKLVILIHGLCMNDLQWNSEGHDHGQALRCDLNFSPLYLHYNTGLHISENGKALAIQIQKLIKAWPQPVDEIVLLGHSMGGLVARSALHYLSVLPKAKAITKPKFRIIFLGTPHQGAPLERAGHWVDLMIGFSPYSAPFVRLGKIRSDGIQDLRYGYLLQSDWRHLDDADNLDHRTPLPLPKTVQVFAIAGSMQAAERPANRDLDELTGDGLVPVTSALGLSVAHEHDLGIPKTRQHIVYLCNHFDLLSSPDAYQTIQRWLKRKVH